MVGWIAGSTRDTLPRLGHLMGTPGGQSSRFEAGPDPGLPLLQRLDVGRSQIVQRRRIRGHDVGRDTAIRVQLDGGGEGRCRCAHPVILPDGNQNPSGGT